MKNVVCDCICHLDNAPPHPDGRRCPHCGTDTITRRKLRVEATINSLETLTGWKKVNDNTLVAEDEEFVTIVSIRCHLKNAPGAENG